MNVFLSEIDKNRRNAVLLLSKMPHIIPHHERVSLFRKYITNDKTVLGLTESACTSSPTTLIIVHRLLNLSFQIFSPTITCIIRYNLNCLKIERFFLEFSVIRRYFIDNV